MFRHRSRREVPSLDTTSTADISFMLLIFFLVTSSMDTDKGLLRQLPPVQDEQAVLDVKKDDVLSIKLDSLDRLTCNDEEITTTELTKRVSHFAAQGRQTHIIGIQTSRHSTYDAYYQMQNAIVAAYNHLRDKRARQVYGRSFKHCTASQKNAVAEYYPMRVSETMNAEHGTLNDDRSEN